MKVSCEVSGCSVYGKQYLFEYTPCCHVPLCEEHFEELVQKRKCSKECTSSYSQCDVCFDINGFECDCKNKKSKKRKSHL
jgi:hypothetical protein